MNALRTTGSGNMAYRRNNVKMIRSWGGECEGGDATRACKAIRLVFADGCAPENAPVVSACAWVLCATDGFGPTVSAFIGVYRRLIFFRYVRTDMNAG